MIRRAIQVVDLGFGDAGKGSLIDYLAACHNADWIVRFNGGPQAGHNVVLPDGRHHTFAQFGSASFHPHVRTLLSRFMLIEPYAMLNEAAHLAEIGGGNVIQRTWIDERCLVITPPQQIANRLRERARAEDAHGTCGMGIGECMTDFVSHPSHSLRAGDFRDPALVARKLRTSLEIKSAEIREMVPLATPEERRVFNNPSWINTTVVLCSEIARHAQLITAEQAAGILRESPCTIFEGAQGVLLDERFGFHPHTTFSKTTFTNADALLDESAAESVRLRIGVTRSYLVRHGNGPLVTEDERLNCLAEPHNRDDGLPGRFRRGVFDLVMLRYAIEACGTLDAIALTCLDQIALLPAIVCDGYNLDGRNFVPKPSTESGEMETLAQSLKQASPRYRPWPVESETSFISALESEARLSIAYESHGPTRDQKAERISLISPSRFVQGQRAAPE